MSELNKEVLLAKRKEYENQMQMHQNTVIAIQGAIEAIDDLLASIEDAIPLDVFGKAIGAESVEVVKNES